MIQRHTKSKRDLIEFNINLIEIYGHISRVLIKYLGIRTYIIARQIV